MLKLQLQYFWLPNVKNRLIGKDPDDCRQEEKVMTEDGIVGWHYPLDGYEFEKVPGVGNGQRSLACCSPWCHKQPDMTEQLNLTQFQALWEK